MLELQDVMEGARSKHATPAKKRQVFKPVNLEKAILEGGMTKDARNYVYDMVTKDLRSTDINQLRLVSMQDRVEVLANREAIFTDMLEMNPRDRTNDLQFKWRSKRIGDDVADWVNLNVDAFPGEVNMDRPMHENTVGFAGNKIKVRLIADELAKQSPVEQTDVMAEEVDMEVIRLRRFFEQKLLSNTQVKPEGTLVAPRFRGAITASTLYNVSTSGDLTNALIQGRVNAIANEADTEGLGWDVPLVAFCPAVQLPKIRDLMATRYSSEQNVTALGYQDRLMAQFKERGMNPNAVKAYQPDPGAPVLFLANSLMPSGYVWFFRPEMYRLVEFSINGTTGPWVIERPTEALVTLNYMFDGKSLRHPLPENAALLTGINVS